MNTQRLAIVIAASVGIFGTLLPWFNVPILGTINGTKFDCFKYIICLFSVPLILGLVSDRSEPVKGIILKLAAIHSIVAGLIGIGTIIYINSNMDNDSELSNVINATVSIGIGLYLVILAGFLIPIFGIAIKSSSKKDSSVQKKDSNLSTPPSPINIQDGKEDFNSEAISFKETPSQQRSQEKIDQLTSLKGLLDSGAINESEFNREKFKILESK